MKIIIETIPHKKQRYDTVGDWYWEGDIIDSDLDILHIKVSKMSSWKREQAVAYHELYEALWCKAHMVTQKEVDNFDKDFENARKKTKRNLGEPGDDRGAPYYMGHQLACIPENLLIIGLDDNMNDYLEELDSL